MFKSPRGTKDILTNETCLWRKIEDESKMIFALFGYAEIKTPLIEEVGLFRRSLGEASDIVCKQIFTVSVSNKDMAKLCLRPEGTAGIIRAYLEHNLHKKIGLAKLYYMGPMFRAERPQKGRLRQFHHIGAEAIGESCVYLDAEIISLATQLLENLGIRDYSLRLNSLGCKDDRGKLVSLFKKNIPSVLKKLCPDCQQRFQRNILRILDCKNETCRENIKNALNPSEFLKQSYLCKACLSDINSLKGLLNSLNIKFSFDQFLVRGLDYYTKTIFEINHAKLGSQDAIGAGGRYDNLAADLGGPDAGAVGFALGVERLLLATQLPSCPVNKNLVYIITLGDEAKKQGFLLLDSLRKNTIPCDMDYQGKSLKGQLRRANDSGARCVVIIGEDELKKKILTLKDMQSGQQREIKQEDLVKEFLNFQL